MHSMAADKFHTCCAVPCTCQNDRRPLAIASQYNYRSIVKLLRAFGPKPNTNINAELCKASRAGNADKVQKLLDEGADCDTVAVDKPGSTPLMVSNKPLPSPVVPQQCFASCAVRGSGCANREEHDNVASSCGATSRFESDNASCSALVAPDAVAACLGGRPHAGCACALGQRRKARHC